MKILVALFAFIAISASSFAYEGQGTATATVKHDAINVVVPDVNMGETIFGGATLTKTVTATITTGTDASINYGILWSAGTVVGDGLWTVTGTTAVGTVTYKPPTSGDPDDTRTCIMICTVNWLD